MWASIVCRKRLIDERLTAALPDIDAVVVLGAGLDTRAYRLPVTETQILEVDQPVNIARKAAVVRRELPPQPWITLVPMDFEHDELIPTLTAHGYDAAARTVFIWEGVTQYLTASAVRATSAQLHKAAPGSLLVFTYVRRDFIDGPYLYGTPAVYRRFRQRRHVWKSGLDPGEVDGLLAGFGWRLRENLGPQYYAETYIRPAGRRLTASEIEWTAVADRLP